MSARAEAAGYGIVGRDDSDAEWREDFKWRDRSWGLSSRSSRSTMKGPLAIEVHGAGRGLPSGPHPVLGAVFEEGEI